MTGSEARLRASSVEELEGSIQAFSAVLAELSAGHAELAARAERVEEELCRTNVELAAKLAELDAVKRHLEAILACLPTGVVVRDADGAVTRVNAAALSILGCREDELVGERERPGLLGAQAEGTPRELARADGARLVVANRHSRVATADGETVGSVEILDDRTELEAMARRVHQLDKMAALGTMAGGIAHEIRNPLNAVRGFAALLRGRLEGDTKEARWARLIVEGVDECEAIVASMLTFADPERLALETVAARALVDETLAALERDPARGGCAIETSVAEVSFAADRIKLRQALRNLVANAIDAQPAGGALCVEVTDEGERVCLRVHDAGPGIAPDITHRVADPFFTTRADGTGLGLALVHTIARLHGGCVEVAGAPGPLGGADVRLSIPKSQPTLAR